MNSMCNYEILLWRCKADSWEQQEKCDFAIKSPGRNTCLYFCQDMRCDSISAQREFETKKGGDIDESNDVGKLD